MGGFVLAWFAGESILVWRWVKLKAPPPPGALAGASLSAREADVLVLLLAGHTDAEVGARLCVSPDTARAHARAVLRKLGAADRRALRARLLGRPPAAG